MLEKALTQTLLESSLKRTGTEVNGTIRWMSQSTHQESCKIANTKFHPPTFRLQFLSRVSAMIASKPDHELDAIYNYFRQLNRSQTILFAHKIVETYVEG